MAKYESDSDELDASGIEEEDVIEELDESGADEDEEPAPKAKAKAKAKAVDEEEDEAPVRKGKAVGVKSKGKEKTSVKEKNGKHRGTAKATSKTEKAAKHKVTRSRRAGWDIPFDETSLVGRAFKLAMKGCSLKALKKWVAEKGAQPWIISFLRKGERNGATWRVEEADGQFKISAVKMNLGGLKKAA